MIRVFHDPSDDPAFLDLAESAINAAAASACSQLVHVVKIDSWFGDRWFSFAGKIHGAAGVRNLTLTVPPFHPHRVINEARYRTGDSNGPVSFDEPLHTLRTSYSNLRNFVERLGNSMTIGWYSGNSESSGRGSIMVYSSTPEGANGWYVGFERSNRWQAVKLVGIDHREWAMLLAGGLAAR